MSYKTISIDVETYEELRRRKRPGQSFADVIREGLGRRRTAAELLAALPSFEVSISTLDAADAEVRARRRHKARAARL